MRQLGRIALARLISMLSNLTTLASELRELVPLGYGITAAKPVDLFPHTHYVECIVPIDQAAAAT